MAAKEAIASSFIFYHNPLFCQFNPPPESEAPVYKFFAEVHGKSKAITASKASINA
jgi:hypothetical protein